MSDKEQLDLFICEPKKPTLKDWVFDVESFLNRTNTMTSEAERYIHGIKLQGDAFGRCENLLAFLKQLYRKKYEFLSPPVVVTGKKKAFVAMWFSDVMKYRYDNIIRPVLSGFGYDVVKIDEKEFDGLIIEKIKQEISSSVLLLADLTGNRGGVYYEAGIVRGLQMCNHPIQLILSCNKSFFDSDGVHFDVRGDNIILYESDFDYKSRLNTRLSHIERGDLDD